MANTKMMAGTRDFDVGGDFARAARELTACVRDADLAGQRRARAAFLAAHAAALYAHASEDLTRFLRLPDLLQAAAQRVEGLLPSTVDLAREAQLPLAQQQGVGIDQLLFLAHVLDDADCGAHLLQAMRLARDESLAQLPHYLASGRLQLGAASVERVGKASYVTLCRPAVLNAEDEASLADLEVAVDLALLDTRSEVVVLRGSRVDGPRHGGRRVFCSGINLTRLYQGHIAPLWYIERELGVVHKIFRGLAPPWRTKESFEATREKPWIAQVDGFAIGGGCQYLLVMDSIVAAADAYLSLPAQKEGIIPGAANLRLPRWVGERLARQLLLADRRIECASPEGRMICDLVVAPEAVEAAVQGVVERLCASGVVSYAANRRALRVAQEPLDVFRRYMALYAREQAYCHYAPALVANLRRHWNSRRGAALNRDTGSGTDA